MARARSRQPAKNERGSLLKFILIVAAVAWLFRSLVFAPFSIPSGSMLPTLFIGDYLLVAKWPYGYSRYSFPFQLPSFDGRILSDRPERGDVVVFRPTDGGADFVKRVIGLPGDTVAVRNGSLILNGRPVPRSDMEPVAVPISPNSPCRRVTASGVALAVTDEATCIYPSYRETLPNGASYRIIDQADNLIADDLAPTTVPPGRLFLMGDNRDDSFDSRFSPAEGGIGLVPLDHVIGRASAIFWSTDGSASYWKPWTWFTALRTDRIGNSLTAERR